MKPGFGKKKQKKSKQRKNKKKGVADGDDIMADVQQPGSPVEVDVQQAEEHLSAKDKQKKRMELKRALKVKVAGLKQDRNKLTKLAGNKPERRKLNKQIQGLLQEQLLGKSGKQKGIAEPGAAATAREGMLE